MATIWLVGFALLIAAAALVGFAAWGISKGIVYFAKLSSRSGAERATAFLMKGLPRRG